MNKKIKNILFWFHNARPTALPQSIMPAVLSLCIASKHANFSLYIGLLSIIGVIVGHLSINLYDDYFDYRVKNADYRDRMQHKGIRARISKCEYLKTGAATLRQLLYACLIFSSIALVIGLIIWIYRGNVILLIAIVTAILGIFYSGPPLRLSYRGMGEIVIGVMFGPLLMFGVYYSACGGFDISVRFISISVGLLVANIVYTHSIMDYDADCEAGKITFAVLLKKKTYMLLFLSLLLICSYGCIVIGVFINHLSPYCMLVFITLPMAASLIYLMTVFIKQPDRNYLPRFWMGPMGNWERIQKSGIEWFMIRWLIARNLLTYFCLILIAVSLFFS
jgi:1,4-dihydroxy-2-naphthoate octaprenyltransferase